MTQKIKFFMAAAGLIAVIAGAVFAYNGLSKQVNPEYRLAEGQANFSTPIPDNQDEAEPQNESPDTNTRTLKAPDFTVFDTDGNSVKLSDMEGMPVVLNFWASWCPPCKAEMPEFNNVYSELGDEVIFMMVNLTDGQRETKEIGSKYVAENGFSFPVYFDTKQEAAYTYGIRSIPTTLFIDKDGCLVTGAEGQLDENTLRYGISLIQGVKGNEDGVQENGSESLIDLSSFFGEQSGTAVFLDKLSNYTIYNKDTSELRYSPCSTFKIAATLAAFEYGAVTIEQSVITWDGTRWPIESWNSDLNIAEAFHSSCVWYYRKLIDQIGKENLSNLIGILDYGNRDITQWEGSGFNKNPIIDGFWLESSLLISPREQVDMLSRIFEGKTEIAENNIAELKKIMYKESTDTGINIYGKTGSGNGGWFIGFFESDGDNTYFAVFLNEQNGTGGQKAQDIGISIIQGIF